MERTGRRRSRIGAAVAVALLLLAGCGSSATKSSSTTSGGSGAATETTVARTLRVLVTNDDGYAAAGIDAVVEALRALPDTEVTVVAPLTNQSGSGGKTTDGPLTVTDV
ncbi:MAG: 5'/3'-nucleotidase SurE, partial [Acidimicrobiales bacterium]